MSVINIGRNYSYYRFVSNSGSHNVHLEIEDIPKELWDRLDYPDGEWIDEVLTPDINFENYPLPNGSCTDITLEECRRAKGSGEL